MKLKEIKELARRAAEHIDCYSVCTAIKYARPEDGIEIYRMPCWDNQKLIDACIFGYIYRLHRDGTVHVYEKRTPLSDDPGRDLGEISNAKYRALSGVLAPPLNEIIEGVSRGEWQPSRVMYSWNW